jgi:hypothetical protein
MARIFSAILALAIVSGLGLALVNGIDAGTAAASAVPASDASR